MNTLALINASIQSSLLILKMWPWELNMNMDVIEGFHGYHLTGLPTIKITKRLNKTRGLDFAKEAKKDLMETQELICSSQSV